MDDSRKALITRLGLEGSMKTLEKSAALLDALVQTAEASGLDLSASHPNVGSLLLNVAQELSGAADRRAYIAKYIGNGKLANKPQVAAGINLLKKLPMGTPVEGNVKDADFETATGAGITFTEDAIKARGQEIVARHSDELKRDRYAFPLMTLLAEMKEGTWQFADGAKLKASFDAAVLEALGPKTADDDKKIAEATAAKKAAAKGAAASASAEGGEPKAAKGGDKKKEAAASTPSAGAASAGSGGAASSSSAGAEEMAAPGTSGPFVARELKAAVNTPALLEEHFKVTGGKIRTRFPPEPNGYLHIGHAKSMNLNFEGAFLALGKEPGKDGETIFRYDDTNPEKENDVYIRSQADNVSWLGWKPIKVTHTSDYFPELYECAKKLILKGKAYVCHQTKEQMELSRDIARARDGRDPNSPWRDRPIEENMREFERMKEGRYEEGTATLRLKVDMTSPNPTLWDPVAYRIKFASHPHTGDAWCIYPSYDFSHCIVDSLEHIDYSLCTLEFEVRRDIYYWVLEQLDLYRPYVWEFSRLNITHTMLSKRKILKLVEENKVRGWDDPRLATINGLRRRGYAPEAINAFCRNIGVTRNENTILMPKLEHFLREHLDVTARRAFAVLKPLKVTLSNVDASSVQWVEAPDFPRDKALGMHKVAISRVAYIEKDDFRLKDDKDYYGLAPGKVAGLRYAGYVRVDSVVVKDSASGNTATIACSDAAAINAAADAVAAGSSEVVELLCEYDHERGDKLTGTGGSKVKGNLHWVSSSVPGKEPATAEVRLYTHLFTTEEPGSTGDWEAEIDPHSEVVLTNCYVDDSLAHPAAAHGGRLHAITDRFQFERLGYFVVDTDTDFDKGKLVFNQTVSLKEDATVKKIKGGSA